MPVCTRGHWPRMFLRSPGDRRADQTQSAWAGRPRGGVSGSPRTCELGRWRAPSLRVPSLTGRPDIVDIKPANMEDLTEVITASEFHPHHCNLFVYSSSKGSLRLCDMRAAALCDKHSKCKCACPPGPVPGCPWAGPPDAMREPRMGVFWMGWRVGPGGTCRRPHCPPHPKCLH